MFERREKKLQDEMKAKCNDLAPWFSWTNVPKFLDHGPLSNFKCNREPLRSLHIKLL